MQKIQINISEYVDSNLLKDEIPSHIYESVEFQALSPQIVSCIEDFVGKAKKISQIGTTIHMQKEFCLSNSIIIVTLAYPKKTNFINRRAVIMYHIS